MTTLLRPPPIAHAAPPAGVANPADSRPIRSILATDCGSTTTKAILIELTGSGYRLTSRGEAPTTVEAPFEDVTRGVLNAIAEIEELRGRRFLEGDRIITPQTGDVGADLYVSTSSAGGGLQMVVAGVVANMTAQSASRAALGAGAIVMDTLASNDERLPYQKIERIRQLRPDMILLAGGVDGGTVPHVVELAELLAAANPRPRLGHGFDLPVIFAGNREAWPRVEEILRGKVALQQVENVRPVLEAENLGPARDRIHDLFMEHVMAQAPGYRHLMEWTDAPIMPTPGAVGLLIQALHRRQKLNVVGVDIGGATTDVFSVFGGAFNRTVSANLGMSYSISNVLASAGIPGILRWVPFAIDDVELRDRIGNKMIRPTTIPQQLDELQIEQAICREALRLAFEQHREFAVDLSGKRAQERTISDAFADVSPKSLVDLMALDLIVGSGGVLSHAPRRAQSALMMIDAFAPEGITELAVDSIFMMPHLGVLSTVQEAAATEVFERDCLVRLGAVVAPVRRRGKGREGEACARVDIVGDQLGTSSVELRTGELRLLRPAAGAGPDDLVTITVTPTRAFDVGAGAGKSVTRNVHLGTVGLLLDARGRPLVLPAEPKSRVEKLLAWAAALDLYPAQAVQAGKRTSAWWQRESP